MEAMKSLALTASHIFSAALAAVLLAAPLHAQSAAATSANPAAVATERNTWVEQHNRQKKGAQKANPQVVFIGDSITDGWRGNGRKVWEERIAPLSASNFGISGDRTEHVLWRLQDNLFEGISPKVVVIMIGTNNLWRNDPKLIAEGVAKIVEEVQKQAPQAKVLVLGVFPRGQKPTEDARKKIPVINADLAKLDNGRNVFFLDIGDKFLEQDGTISKTIMPDFLHLSGAGYKIWADAIDAKLNSLLR